MELWIRSQDRKNLVKVFDVFVEDDCLIANYQSHYGGCNYTNIGEYNSNVRALEVLDEIQKYILLPNTDNSAYVFEMPKE